MTTRPFIFGQKSLTFASEVITANAQNFSFNNFGLVPSTSTLLVTTQSDPTQINFVTPLLTQNGVPLATTAAIIPQKFDGIIEGTIGNTALVANTLTPVILNAPTTSSPTGTLAMTFTAPGTITLNFIGNYALRFGMNLGTLSAPLALSSFVNATLNQCEEWTSQAAALSKNGHNVNLWYYNSVVGTLLTFTLESSIATALSSTAYQMQYIPTQ
jgi:hypothetical protein